MHVQALATIPYFLKDQIRNLIIDGTFRPGQPLREQDLEQRFGTSRSPIREALRLLELTGMVNHVQRKGFRVRSYSEAEIRQVYALYAELLAYALRQIDTDGARALLPRLHLLDQQLVQAHIAGDMPTYAARLHELYLVGVRRMDDAPLLDTLTRLYGQVEPVHQLFVREVVGKFPYDTFHGGILRAVVAEDTAGAAQAARAHVLDMIPHVVSQHEALALEN